MPSSPNSSAPGDVHFVGAEPLFNGGVRDIHPDAGLVHYVPEPGDHGAVVHAEAPVRYVHPRAAFPGHVVDHAAEAHVLRHASSQQDLVLTHLRHCALGDLGQHREAGLLHGVRYVLEAAALLAMCQRRRHDARERYVHALDGVGEVEEPVAVLGQLLDGGSGVESQSQFPAQLVQHVADAHIQGLPEDAVSAVGERDDLCVASRSVQEGGVVASRHRPSNLDVGDTVVDPDDRDPQLGRQRPCRRTRNAEAGAKSRTHGERDEFDVPDGDARGVQSLRYERRDHIGVVVGCLAGMQPSLCRTVHIQLVGQNLPVGIGDTYTQRVGGSFDTQGQHVRGIVKGI